MEFWGQEDCWGLPENWIDDMHEKRSRIAHGAEDTTVEAINVVATLIPTLEKTSNLLINKIIDVLYDRSIFEYQEWLEL